jgi:serine/threonine protein kinase
MHESPPEPLVALLGQLGLATPAQVEAIGGRARRLARGLPLFASVWVDALAQARILSPLQAAEINAGRGAALRLVPYVLSRRLPSLGFAECYEARNQQNSDIVRLAAIRAAEDSAGEMLKRLQRLVAVSKSLDAPSLAPILDVGSEAGRLWAVCRGISGRTATEWMTHHGRFSPEAVLEIARQMMPSLVALEASGMVHGDLRAATLVLDDAGGEPGQVVLPQPGLRGAVRPTEGYAHADLPPEAFDGLPPERVHEPVPPTTQGDMYACGCLWWHLLTGRSPLPGGNALMKLQAAERAEISDVRQLAPETSPLLVTALASCLEREPGRRGESMKRLAEMLGPSTRSGRAALRRCLAQGAIRPAIWNTPLPFISEMPAVRRMPVWLGVAAGCVLGAAAIYWAIARGALPGMTTPAPSTPVAQAPSPPPETPPKTPPKSEATAVAKKPVPPPPAIKNDLPPPNTKDKELVLDSAGPLSLKELKLAPGQRVHGAPGKRPVLMVPREGLLVAVPDVRFENVDFAWDYADALATTEPAAIVRLQASGAEFHGCTFRSTQPTTVAVRWVHPVDRAGVGMTLPSGQMKFENCVFQNIDAAVDCRTIGAVAISATNTLHLGGGPLIRLDHAPGADEPVLVQLARTTLRGSGPLLECRHGKTAAPGKITIRTTGCALLHKDESPLLHYVGEASPEPLLKQITWEGQGSLVGPRSAIAGWLHPDGRRETLDDAAVAIDGLARSDVDFAGPAGPDPSTSRVTRWQAPLQSTDPPGVDVDRLPKPPAGR